MCLDLGHTLPLLNLLDDPGDRFAQGLTKDRATGLADGRQTCLSPFLHTVLPQLSHQGAVRQEHEIHVPCLALATPELTLAHTQMLLPVPMKGLGSCPALALDFEDAMHFPIGPIGDQDLAWFGVALVLPQHHNPYCVLDAGNADTLGEIPLLLALDSRFAPAQRSQFAFHPLTGFPVLTIDGDGAIELQIADVSAAVAVNVVEDVSMGEVTVEGEIARNVVLDDPIYQFLTQDSVVLEGHAGSDTGILLAEATEFQGIVLARRTDVVGNQIVMVDQRVINRDHTMRGVVGGGVALQEVQAPLVERLFIPLNLSNPAVETGLVGGD